VPIVGRRVLTNHITIAAAAAWTPASLSGLVGWWEGDVGVTDAGAGRVSSWADQSGLGATMNQGLGANRPTTGTVTVNGLNGIAFDSTHPDILAASMSFAMPAVAYIVCKVDTPTGFQALFSASAAGNMAFGCWNGFPAIGQNGNPDLASGTAFPSGANQFTLIFNGASSEIWMNGTQIASGAATTSAVTDFKLGVRGSNDAGLTGSIEELFVGTGSSRNTSAETYLKSRWATP
jgi:hypothetical protein